MIMSVFVGGYLLLGGSRRNRFGHQNGWAPHGHTHIETHDCSAEFPGATVVYLALSNPGYLPIRLWALIDLSRRFESVGNSPRFSFQTPENLNLENVPYWQLPSECVVLEMPGEALFAVSEWMIRERLLVVHVSNGGKGENVARHELAEMQTSNYPFSCKG